MHIGKARHLKICEVLGKMKKEDLRGLIRRYRGRNYVVKFQDILHGSKRFQHRTALTCAHRTEWGARLSGTLH